MRRLYPLISDPLKSREILEDLLPWTKDWLGHLNPNHWRIGSKTIDAIVAFRWQHKKSEYTRPSPIRIEGESTYGRLVCTWSFLFTGPNITKIFRSACTELLSTRKTALNHYRQSITDFCKFLRELYPWFSPYGKYLGSDFEQYKDIIKSISQLRYNG